MRAIFSVYLHVFFCSKFLNMLLRLLYKNTQYANSHNTMFCFSWIKIKNVTTASLTNMDGWCVLRYQFLPIFSIKDIPMVMWWIASVVLSTTPLRSGQVCQQQWKVWCRRNKKIQGRDVIGIEAAYPGLQATQNLGRIWTCTYLLQHTPSYQVSFPIHYLDLNPV